MARTVADAAAVLQVVAGYDPDDPVTDSARVHPVPNYAASLVKDGLKGARIGVLRQAFEGPTVDPEVRAIFNRALDDLRKAGATVLDTVLITESDSIRRSGPRGGCNPFRAEFDEWLAQNPGAPVKTVEQIFRSRQYHPSIEARLGNAVNDTTNIATAPACAARQRIRVGLRDAVTRTMDRLQLDALVYPTWSNPPRLIGDLNTPAGDNSQVFSPTTGMPAITVPMGYSRNNTLPAGMTIFGRAFDEARLIRLAYAYEQATHWRRQPATAP
jgi:Asp-tRNA(Asn)/Glu-tRNA(Gln) amidotransferase A subunit family amidase